MLNTLCSAHSLDVTRPLCVVEQFTVCVLSSSDSHDFVVDSVLACSPATLHHHWYPPLPHPPHSLTHPIVQRWWTIL